MDWTPITTSAITLLGTGLGGLLGFAGARRQASVELARIGADNARLVAEYDEDHFRHRQGVYHDFIDAVWLWSQYWVGTMNEPSELDARRRQVQHCVTAIELFASDQVRATVSAAIQQIDAIDEGDNSEAKISSLRLLMGSAIASMREETVRPMPARRDATADLTEGSRR